MAAMSSWTTRWHHLLSKTRAVSVDSFSLFSAVVRKQGGETTRDVLVSQARLTNNRCAMSLLRMDREIGLIRYMGFLAYLRDEKNFGESLPPMAKRMLYGSSKSTGGGGEPEDTDEDKNKWVAKVAFMITSTQRTELSERLGYEADQIKRLKPIEASLILENSLVPSEVEDKLAGLVQEYNVALAKNQEQDEKDATLVHPANPSWPLSQTPPDCGSDRYENNQILLGSLTLPDQSAGETAKAQVDDNATPSSLQDDSAWFEVVETRSLDGSSVGVALYRNEDEARLCLEMKEEFAHRHAREKDGKLATTYNIRKTVK